MKKSSRVGAVALTLSLLVGAVVSSEVASAQEPSTQGVEAAETRAPGDRVTWSGAMQPLVPTRILDTRSGVGAPAGKVAARADLEIEVTDLAGVPSTGVGAVVLNLTATQSEGGGYLTVWPTGAARPKASSLNMSRGDSVANAVVAKVGRDGRVSIHNGGSATHVLADVTGWFPEGGGVEPLVPTRLLDTREPPVSALGPRAVRKVKVTNVAGVPSTGVSSVVLNVTATAPTAASSYLTVWPTGAARPTTSNLNVVRGQTVPNAVISKVGADGTVSIYNDSGSVHVAVDIVGWFPDDTIRAVVPARLLDTRTGLGAAKAAVGPGGTVSFVAVGRGGVPATGVSAVVLNVTATRPSGDSYLTVWPNGAARPTASSVNFRRGATVPNLVVAKVGAGGRVSVFNHSGSTEVLADVVGWFPDATASATTTIQPWRDAVIVGGGDVVARTGDSMVGGTLTLSRSADVPAVGDPIAAMPGGVTPEGVVGLVTAVTPSPTTTLVSFAPTDVGSVFADFEESYDGPVGSSPVAGRQAHDLPGRGVAPLADGGFLFSPRDGLDCSGSAVNVSGLDLDLNDANVDWDVDLSERRVRFVMGVTPTLTATVGSTGQFSCSMSQDLPPVPIGSIWITPSLGMGLNGSYNGSFTGTAAAPVTVGFEYDDGADNLSSANLTGSANFAATANGTVGVTSGVGLDVELFGRVGIGSSFDISVTGSLDIAKNPCVTVDLAPTIGFAVTVDLWLKDWEFDVAEFNGPPVRLYSANPNPPCVPFTPPSYRIIDGGIDHDGSATLDGCGDRCVAGSYAISGRTESRAINSEFSVHSPGSHGIAGSTVSLRAPLQIDSWTHSASTMTTYSQTACAAPGSQYISDSDLQHNGTSPTFYHLALDLEPGSTRTKANVSLAPAVSTEPRFGWVTPVGLRWSDSTRYSTVLRTYDSVGGNGCSGVSTARVSLVTGVFDFFTSAGRSTTAPEPTVTTRSCTPTECVLRVTGTYSWTYSPQYENRTLAGGVSIDWWADIEVTGGRPDPAP